MSYVQLLNKVTEDIDRVGWSVMSVSANNDTDLVPQFAYTIGLWQTYKHPEVIILGLPISVAHILLNDIGKMVKVGKAIKQYPELHYGLIENYPVAFFAVEQDLDDEVYSSFFGTGRRFYGDRTPTLQMIYPDKFGLFPWQDRCSQVVINAQPTLSRSIAQQKIDWDKAEGWGVE